VRPLCQETLGNWAISAPFRIIVAERKDFKWGFGRAPCKANPVPGLTQEEMIAEGDKVMCRNIWRFTDTASRKRRQFCGFVLWRFDGGKMPSIAKRWAMVTPPGEDV